MLPVSMQATADVNVGELSVERFKNGLENWVFNSASTYVAGTADGNDTIKVINGFGGFHAYKLIDARYPLLSFEFDLYLEALGDDDPSFIYLYNTDGAEMLRLTAARQTTYSAERRLTCYEISSTTFLMSDTTLTLGTTYHVKFLNNFDGTLSFHLYLGDELITVMDIALSAATAANMVPAKIDFLSQDGDAVGVCHYSNIIVKTRHPGNAVALQRLYLERFNNGLGDWAIDDPTYIYIENYNGKNQLKVTGGILSYGFYQAALGRLKRVSFDATLAVLGTNDPAWIGLRTANDDKIMAINMAKVADATHRMSVGLNGDTFLVDPPLTVGTEYHFTMEFDRDGYGKLIVEDDTSIQIILRRTDVIPNADMVNSILRIVTVAGASPATMYISNLLIETEEIVA